MLVNLYKSKTPLSVFTLPLIIGLACLSLFFNEPAHNIYFFVWQTDFFGWIQGITWLNYLIAGAVISLNAHLLNSVFNNNTFYSKGTSLPGFIYVTGLITFKSLDFSPVLIEHFFLIAALAQLLLLKRQESAKDIIFKASFFIGIALIFSPLSAVLILLPWIALAIVKPFIWREWLISFFGILLPTFYHYVINFIVTKRVEIKTVGVAIDNPDVVWTIIEGLTYLSATVVILVGLIKFLIVMRSQIINFKKLSQILLWMTIFSAVTFVGGWYFYDQLYIPFLLPLSFIISIQLVNAGRVKLANGLMTAWFIISVVNLFS